MKKTIRNIAIIVIMITAVAAITGYFLYTKPQADLAQKKADVVTTATNLYNDYSNNEKTSDSLYLDKIIEVTGNVAEMSINTDSSLSISLHEPTIDFGVGCNILKPTKQEIEEIIKGDVLVIRGVCSGFNGFEVALNNCAVVSH